MDVSASLRRRVRAPRGLALLVSEARDDGPGRARPRDPRSPPAGCDRYAWDASPFYRRKWDEAVFHPCYLKSLEDFESKVPVIDKKDLRAAQARTPPFGDYLCVPDGEVFPHPRHVGHHGPPHSMAMTLCFAWPCSTRAHQMPATTACGFDAVYVDLEHTTTSLETAGMLCASARGAGIDVLVQVPYTSRHDQPRP